MLEENYRNVVCKADKCCILTHHQQRSWLSDDILNHEKITKSI